MSTETMELRKINYVPALQSDNRIKGVSKLTDFVNFERSYYFLKGQKYVETHNEKQIEHAFCRTLITATIFRNRFDYDRLLHNSSMRIGYTIHPSKKFNPECFQVDENEERLSVSIQKLEAFAFGMAHNSDEIKEAIRKHEIK